MSIAHLCYEQMCVSGRVSMHIRHLVHFEATVDVADKCQRSPEGHTTQHQWEDKRREERVAKELGGLHQAAHGGTVPVVENGVDENKEAGGASAEHAPPPPSVVLTGQQEVGESHRYAGAHWEEDDKDAQEDTVEGVVLSAPNGGENVVQLHWDGAEGGKWCRWWKWKNDTKSSLT